MEAILSLSAGRYIWYLGVDHTRIVPPVSDTLSMIPLQAKQEQSMNPTKHNPEYNK